jgi:hypothetical protein
MSQRADIEEKLAAEYKLLRRVQGDPQVTDAHLLPGEKIDFGKAGKS